MVRDDLIIGFTSSTINVFRFGDLPYSSEVGPPTAGDMTHWIVDLNPTGPTCNTPASLMIPIPYPPGVSAEPGQPFQAEYPLLPPAWYINRLDATAPVIFETAFMGPRSDELERRMCRFKLDFTRDSDMAPLAVTVSLASAFIVPRARLGAYIHEYGVAWSSFDCEEGYTSITYVYEPDPNSGDVDDSWTQEVGGLLNPNKELWTRARLSQLPYTDNSYRFLSGCPTGRYLWFLVEHRAEPYRSPPGQMYVVHFNEA